MAAGAVRAVMVQGCTSSAGKSLLATALCRWYADRGLRVLPFKAQNMSTHARVAAGPAGTGEIGVAQWLQAHAARAEPDVRMNPVLVKPEGRGSQVVVLGRADPGISRLPWRERAPRLRPVVTRALDSLLAEADLVVCEGAGSPAEVNLAAVDLANMAVARHAGAPALLVADIDRGGALAHLVGTWELVDEPDRGRLAAFVLNRFRGDPELLGNGPAVVTGRTGMACAGVLPMLDHDLPDEDGATWGGIGAGAAPAGDPVVAVVRYPSASNLDELAAVARVAVLVHARRPGDVAGADLVVLPGSKDVAADLDWLRRTGLDTAVTTHAAGGGRVLGVCGGLHLLGRTVTDAHGVEGGRGPWRRAGLGLLPVDTEYSVDKAVTSWHARFAPGLDGPWERLAAREVAGYDIRYGRTRGPGAVMPPDRAWTSGAVLGVAGHGLLEDGGVVSALLGRPAPGAAALREASFDRLAAAVTTHLDTDLLARLTGGLL
ncbi:MAG: cobyric acid synthase [Kineosporiaceae bacterium]